MGNPRKAELLEALVNALENRHKNESETSISLSEITDPINIVVFNSEVKVEISMRFEPSGEDTVRFDLESNTKHSEEEFSTSDSNKMVLLMGSNIKDFIEETMTQ